MKLICDCGNETEIKISKYEDGDNFQGQPMLGEYDTDRFYIDQEHGIDGVEIRCKECKKILWI